MTGTVVRVRARRNARMVMIALTVLAGCLYGWGLYRGGTHYYYNAAVLSMSTSWRAFVFGAFDPAGSMTVDKLPGGFWVQALLVRLLGFHTWVLLLPGALAATATVPLLFATVRRWAGEPAGLIASAVFLTTPVTFAAARINLVDSLLVFCLVAAAYATTCAVADARWRWLLTAGALVGAGFQIKMIEAWVVLPALAAACLAQQGLGVRQRLLRTAVLSATTVVASLAWLVAVSLVPIADRPHVDGSRGDSWWEMVFVYNGLGRGLASTDSPLSAATVPYGGSPGPLRLLNDQLGGQIGWLLPLAVVFLATGWWTHRRDPLWTLWGGWLVVAVIVLSVPRGIHPYYATLLAPALAAITGTGVHLAWTRWRDRRGPLGWILPTGIAASAVVAVVIVSRTPGPAWLTVLIATAIIAAMILGTVQRRLSASAATLGALAVLAGPVSWITITPAVSVNSMHTANPVAGPQTAEAVFGASDPRITLARILGTPPIGPVPAIDAALPGSQIDPGLLGYLLAHHAGERFLFASGEASSASPYISAGHSVLPLGGFTGFSPYPDLRELTDLVRRGHLRFLYLTAVAGLPGILGERADWALAHCTPMSPHAYNGHPNGMTLFDCAL